MKALVFALVIVLSCGSATVVTPSPTATQSPAPTITAKWFSVTVVTPDMPDNPTPDKIARYLRANLSTTWEIATQGRSTLFMNTYAERSDILVIVEPYASVPRGGWAIPWARVVVVYEQPGAPLSWYATRLVPHELAHVWSCCVGRGTIGEHWNCPDPAKGPLMCPDMGDAQTFNEDELAQMGLGAP